MNYDQTLALWNVIGTWFAALSTLGAVVVALYLSSKDDKLKLKIHIGVRELVYGTGVDPVTLVAFDVTNIGNKPVVINSIGWVIGSKKKERYAIQFVSNFYSSGFPTELNYGKSTMFGFSLKENPNWAKEFNENFVRDSSLDTLRGRINTSVGISFDIKPENNLIEMIKNHNQHA